MKRLLLGLFLLSGCAANGSTDPAEAPTPARVQAVPVRVADANTVELVRSLELGGIAAAWRSARLAPAGQGIVKELHVELGQVIKQGTVLAELDASTLKLQLAQARKSAELGHLQLENARTEAARATMLEAEGAIASQQIDQAQMSLQLAEAQVAQAEASLAVLQDQINKAQLIAPFAGTVTGVFLEQGEFFTGMAGMGGPPALVSIDALDPIRLDVHVPDVDLARLEPGMRAIVSTDALPDRQWEGEIALVSAAADPGSRTFTARIRVPNADHALKPGLFLTARLVLEQRDAILAIPEVAIADPDSESPFVMVVEEGVARRKPVKLGLKGDEGWAVEGISEGEQVVTEGHFGLPDGAKVRVIE